MRIKQQTGVRYEQFDFGYYNRTRFAGLENDLANCYANPLLQVQTLILSLQKNAIENHQFELRASSKALKEGVFLPTRIHRNTSA